MLTKQKVFVIQNIDLKQEVMNTKFIFFIFIVALSTSFAVIKKKKFDVSQKRKKAQQIIRKNSNDIVSSKNEKIFDVSQKHKQAHHKILRKNSNSTDTVANWGKDIPTNKKLQKSLDQGWSNGGSRMRWIKGGRGGGGSSNGRSEGGGWSNGRSGGSNGGSSSSSSTTTQHSLAIIGACSIAVYLAQAANTLK